MLAGAFGGFDREVHRCVITANESFSHLPSIAASFRGPRSLHAAEHGDLAGVVAVVGYHLPEDCFQRA